MERKKPAPQEFYRHFKGKLYQIVTVAIHSETKEELVIYQALYGDFAIYARPLSMFMSEVEHDKYPNVSQTYRFEKVELSQFENKQEQKEISVENTVNSTTETADIKAEDGLEQVNPDLLRFLDADTLEEKYKVLVDMKTRLTDRLIDDIAAAMDVTVEEGDLDTRYKDLLVCVDTMKRFEVNRLR